MGKTGLWFLLVTAPTALMIGVFALVFGGDDGTAAALHAFHEETRSLEHFFEIFTDCAALPFYLAYALILAAAVKNRDKEAGRFVAYALVSLVVTLAAVYCLKVVVSRPRPHVGIDHEGWYSFNKKFHSFPSNHVSEIFALTLPFALRHKIPWFALALGLYNALAAFSRLYLGSHYPTDILGSLAAGSLISLACFALTNVLFARSEPETAVAGEC